jgi:hypothetical protein
MGNMMMMMNHIGRYKLVDGAHGQTMKVQFNIGFLIIRDTASA